MGRLNNKIDYALLRRESEIQGFGGKITEAGCVFWFACSVLRIAFSLEDVEEETELELGSIIT